MKVVAAIIGAIVIAAAAFWGGTFYAGMAAAPAGLPGASFAGGAGGPGGPGGGGGPFAQLTDDQRQQLRNASSEEERTKLLSEFGLSPGSMQGGARREPIIEGTVVSAGDDSVTVALEKGGSATVYRDRDTLIATAEGAESGDLAKDTKVTVLALPDGDQLSARVIVIR